ncbi:hypothetical protein AOLI_G00289100 [Acnodon oligacanthus]
MWGPIPLLIFTPTPCLSVTLPLEMELQGLAVEILPPVKWDKPSRTRYISCRRLLCKQTRQGFPAISNMLLPAMVISLVT